MDYEMKTTFWYDFSIADIFGKSAILDTANRAFQEWHDNVEYITEFIMVLNWKCWDHYEKHNDSYSRLYQELWEKYDTWACNTLRGDDLRYYYRTTD